MSLKYQISKIPTEYTIELRQRVLKPFLHPEDCINPGDDDPTTTHLGLFHERKLVSICTFLSEPHPSFNSGNPTRLRGMATLQKYRGQGFGRILLQYGFNHLRQNRSDFLWCNARSRAFSFYTTMGLFYHGEMFDLDRIGPHKVMYRSLNSR
ncbi:MAG: GNAT family N-acetyltransferase [Bdellovibrionaceae bacterium]|nr:GNAT family N-acetyltransferase [Pseudobdellovibrionaceae bacterium]